MKIIVSPTAVEHYRYWKDTNNTAIIERIKVFLGDISQHPFTGIGRPEPLKGQLSGLWSRRINREHRLIYSVSGDEIHVFVLSMRYHYGK